MIKTKNLSKHYRNGFGKTIVVDNVDLSVQEGDFLTIMGPSGAGKSTLLNIIGMLDTPSSGEYYFNGISIHEMNDKKRSEVYKNFVGFVFQNYHLIDDMTVYENIEIPLLYRKINSSERKGKVADILDQFQIVAKKDLFPNQLSGGQQQIVGIARALIGNPRLIIADEPTGNLNSEQGEEIMDIFQELNKIGTTIIQVTHSEKNASYSDRIINLMDGKVITD